MTSRGLRAPSGDGELLALPPLEQAGECWRENVEKLDQWNLDLQGRNLFFLRALASEEVLTNARRFHEMLGLSWPEAAPGDPPPRFLITGHQPELFHPGVWVKNFAIAALARRLDALPLNLIVDNDLPKSSEIRVPNPMGESLSIERVAFDSGSTEVPFEDWRVHDETFFASFGERVLETLGGLIPQPLIRKFWPTAVDSQGLTPNLGLRFSRARHLLEESWGVQNLEIPLGVVCETESFQWFLCHILANLHHYQSIHNDALLAYRRLHGIRSRNHPVASLERRGEWLEAPFWVWRGREPRRRALLVRPLSKAMELRIGGEDEPFAELPLAADREACCAVERLRELPGEGIRIRTRALTTTMYARLMLGNLFVHGIGGAKYDELGDEIFRGFLGSEPPIYLTLSMTLRLGLPGSSRREKADELRGIDHLLRDLRFNPDRHLSSDAGPEVIALIAAKRAAIGLPSRTRLERRFRNREIRSINELLQAGAGVMRQRSILQTKRVETATDLKRAIRAASREYSMVLHDQKKLAGALSLFGISSAPD